MNDEVTVDTVDAQVDEVEETTPEAAEVVTDVADETEGNEVEDEGEGEPKPEKSSTSKKEDGVQKRIDELTKIRRETERDRDYWKNLAQDTQAAPEPVEPGKTLSDFEYDEGKYATYLTDQAKADARAEVDRQLQVDKQARSRAEFSSKEADFSTDIDDYHIVTRNNDLKINQYMVEAVQGSDKGPEVLYYLGKNPDVAERLSGMSPINMAREMGRIEATKLVKAKPSLSTAPAPAPKLAGAAKSSVIKPTEANSDSLSTKEWMRRRNKQVRG